MRPTLLVLVALCAVALQGCCIFGTTRTVYTPLPHIPVGEAPPLTGHEPSDFHVIGADALRSRNLINRYNAIAQQINEKHGVETPSLESVDIDLGDAADAEENTSP